MDDLPTALLKDEAGDDLRSTYQRVEEIVQRVRPFVKVRRLVRVPRAGALLSDFPARVKRKH